MSSIDDALNTIGKDIVDDLKNLVKKYDFKATGNLDKSFYYEVKENQVTVYGAKYAKALSDGIKKRPSDNKNSKEFRNSIEKWAKVKGIIPRDKNGRFVKRTPSSFNKMINGIVFGIKKNGISKRFGYRGAGFLDTMKKNAIKNIEDKILNAFKQDLIVNIKEIQK